jgi:hypothetical protein
MLDKIERHPYTVSDYETDTGNVFNETKERSGSFYLSSDVAHCRELLVSGRRYIHLRIPLVGCGLLVTATLR